MMGYATFNTFDATILIVAIFKQ